MGTTGFVWHERYAWHDTGRGVGPFPAGGWLEPDLFVENADTKRRIRHLLDASGLLADLVALPPRPATREEVERVHGSAYLDGLVAGSAGLGGDGGDGITPYGPGSYDIALLAAGGVIGAVDAVLDGRVESAFALVRPPGHHATPDLGMGFCLINNVAVAARHARDARGLGRVAIVDWDVHHGNGTQAAFYEDPTVLTVSVHQDGCFPPGSGPVGERGAGDGEGANLNVPLPPGCGTAAYVEAFERVVVPALRAFAPDLVLVASGLDAAGMDPLGRMLLHSESYRRLAGLVVGAAQELCGGRVVVAHEGGYSNAMAPFCALAVVETLAGRRTEVEDPFVGLVAGMGGEELADHQRAAVDRAEAALGGAV
jgi:acetoin utilization deacetylase AcuC-like enzyme